MWMSWHSLGNLNRELWSDKAQVGTLPEKLGYALYSIIIFHFNIVRISVNLTITILSIHLIYLIYSIHPILGIANMAWIGLIILDFFIWLVLNTQNT